MTAKKPKSVLGRAPAIERVYALLDPRDLVVRYIGHTKQPLCNRLSAHCNLFEASTAKEAWILGLLKIGLRPRIKEIAKVFHPQAVADEEASWMRFYISKGFVLFNIYTPGLPDELKRIFTADEMVALTEGRRVL